MMKILFISNYYTHHQQPLCEALDKLTGHQFTFVSTEPFPEDRKRLGWSAQENVPFVKTCEVLLEEDENAIRNADVVILGSAPLMLVRERLKERKPVFFYAERVYKSGYEMWKWLPRLVRFWMHYGRHSSLYLLAASGYTAADYALHGAFLGKAYRWGYFPAVTEYALPALMERKDPRKILWCGRFLDWKHPEAALAVARRLKAEGYSFQMEFLGTGPMEDTMKRQAAQSGLSDCVSFLGSVPADRVRSYMENAGIYLFTSDFHEGWGAVLNEAMNSGCAVVAGHGIGSVPFLLEHGKNGLVYPNGDTDSLYRHVQALLEDPQRQKQLGEKAYQTVTQQWNGETAARRFLELAEEIRCKGKSTRFSEGPCSKAPVIWNNWFRG